MRHILLYEEYLKGGKGDETTLSSIAKAYVKKRGGDYDKTMKIIKKNYDMGLKVEKEHTSNDNIASEIAKDHLSENPKYYEILKKAHLADEL